MRISKAQRTDISIVAGLKRFRLGAYRGGTARISGSRSEKLRAFFFLPESSLIDCGFGAFELFHDPSEIRDVAENHSPHFRVIPFDHRARFWLRKQPERFWNGLFKNTCSVQAGSERV